MANDSGQDEEISLKPALVGLVLLLVIGGVFWSFSSSKETPTKTSTKTGLQRSVPRNPFGKTGSLHKAKKGALGIRNAKRIRLPDAVRRQVRGPKLRVEANRSNRVEATAASSATAGEKPIAKAIPPDASGVDVAKKPTGSLSRDAVQAGIAAVKPQIVKCFEQGLKHDPSLAGKIVIQFEIKADEEGRGVVERGEVKSSEVMSPFFEACVLQKIGGQEFEAPEGGGTVVVNYPFNFDPGGGFGGEAPGDDDKAAQ